MSRLRTAAANHPADYQWFHDNADTDFISWLDKKETSVKAPITASAAPDPYDAPLAELRATEKILRLDTNEYIETNGTPDSYSTALGRSIVAVAPTPLVALQQIEAARHDMLRVQYEKPKPATGDRLVPPNGYEEALKRHK